MNRPLTALFAALEALLVVGVGIGLTLAPLTLMWAFEYGLQIDWIVFWRAAVDLWLIGHGVDVAFVLDATVATSTGLPGAADGFTVTVALLGFALVTLLLAVRAGRRIGETPHRLTGHSVAVLTFAALAAAATLSAGVPAATPVVWQGILLPTIVFALGSIIGSVRATAGGRPQIGASAGSSTPPATSAVPATTSALMSRALTARSALERRAEAFVPRDVRDAVTGILVSATLTVAAIMAIASVTVAVLLATSYGQIIGLFEAVQSGYLGGAALTMGQLAALPNLVVWAASWFVGPGFAIGSGSAVSPLGTVLGPIPAVPMLGALPESAGDFAFIGLLVPIVASFVAAALMRRRLVAVLPDSRWALVAAGAAIGAAGGILLAILSWASSGSAGPGRLVEVGPHWAAVGGWGALEITIAAVLALLVGGLDLRAMIGREAHGSDSDPGRDLDRSLDRDRSLDLDPDPDASLGAR